MRNVSIAKLDLSILYAPHTLDTTVDNLLLHMSGFHVLVSYLSLKNSAGAAK